MQRERSSARNIWPICKETLPVVISFRAKSPSAKLTAEMVGRFVVEPEASMQRLISLIPKTLFPRERIPSFIIRPPGLRFRPMVVYFWAPGKTQIRPFQFRERCQLFIRPHNETLSVAVCVNNEDCAGLYPVIRNSLVGLAPYLGKFRALNQIEEFHCHSFFSELRPLPVVVQ